MVRPAPNNGVHQQGERPVRVEVVRDPAIQEPTGVSIKVTSTAICGSGLHPFQALGRLTPGDVIGHDLPDDRSRFLSGILPTAWQGVGP